MSNLLSLYDGREKKGSKSQSHSMASKGDLYTERELRRKEAYPLIDNNIIKLTHRSNVLRGENRARTSTILTIVPESKL